MPPENKNLIGLEALASFGEICAATENGTVPLIQEVTSLVCKDIIVEKLVASNGRITIKMKHGRMTGKQKRAIGLYQGKRKEKHFYRK
ncbi:hypothetical protein [Eubacterium sp.]|uniref:hypothetical protein n=1 Tax=Eubacterium sp. TaxID=142586 RepID=UPI0026E04494|nr:hypothetical protein [Eubacterium sp.]MDO5433345.1 hypothetical protein [Eubacterium sp.]